MAQGLPRVTINFENGLMGTVEPNSDGVLGFLTNGTSVVDGIQYNIPYTIFSLAQLEDEHKVTEDNNPTLYKDVREFYDEAGEGTELWIMMFQTGVDMAGMLSVTDSTRAKALLMAANGRLKGLLVSGTASDMEAVMAAGQALGVWSTDTLYSPIFVMLAYDNFDGDAVALKDLTQSSFNRVGVMIGDTESGSRTAAIGMLGGRIAKIPVQRNIGRVRDGPLSSIKGYIYNLPAEKYLSVTQVHNKGYITLATYTGKSGYFFSDDPLATGYKDDYRQLTNRRVIDKAYRVAYSALILKLKDEVPIVNDGTIRPAFAKAWELDVENAIASSMTFRGELSADPDNADDRGCQAFIDPKQNVLQTSEIKVSLRARPFGYARWITVQLGFLVTSS